MNLLYLVTQPSFSAVHDELALVAKCYHRYQEQASRAAYVLFIVALTPPHATAMPLKTVYR